MPSTRSQRHPADRLRITISPQAPVARSRYYRPIASNHVVGNDQFFFGCGEWGKHLLRRSMHQDSAILSPIACTVSEVEGVHGKEYGISVKIRDVEQLD
jgi:hypothetical protein